mmetsp:Transcript_6489/g.14368  ORF Transcript_6489/g.14368 Transcript_6489/m.14368 type:complete len:83 (+) Transcript_6489:1613-1861(+)
MYIWEECHGHGTSSSDEEEEPTDVDREVRSMHRLHKSTERWWNSRLAAASADDAFASRGSIWLPAHDRRSAAARQLGDVAHS